MITREQIEKTTAEWESQNPTLAADVIGIEVTSTNYLRYKRGNGSSAWSALPYIDKIPPSVGGGGVDLDTATGVLPVAKGGTGAETAAAALTALGGQSVVSIATAATTSAVAGGKDIDLRVFTERDRGSVFSNARYSSSYGYGIRCAKAGYYLISATLNLQNNTTTSSTVTAAIRRVVGGTSSYIARAGHTFEESTSGHATTLTFAPQIFSLEANSYLSLYNSLSTVVTKAEGCWLTAVYLGE